MKFPSIFINVKISINYIKKYHQIYLKNQLEKYKMILHTKWKIWTFYVKQHLMSWNTQGHVVTRLKSSFEKFDGLHNNLVCRYGISVSKMRTSIFLWSWRIDNAVDVLVLYVHYLKERIWNICLTNTVDILHN